MRVGMWKGPSRMMATNTLEAESCMAFTVPAACQADDGVSAAELSERSGDQSLAWHVCLVCVCLHFVFPELTFCRRALVFYNGKELAGVGCV